MQQQVHPGDRGGGEHLLLAVQLAEHRLRVTAARLDVLDDLDQHAAGATGRVVDRLALLRVKNVDQQRNHLTRSVVLAGLLVGLVGEPLDQIFVRLPQHIGGCLGHRKGLGREVLDQVDQLAVRELVLVGPGRAAEDAVQRALVGLFDSAEGSLQRLTNVLGAFAHVCPVASLRDGEPVVLLERRIRVVATGLIQRAGVLLVVHIADPLEEHQREDVRLEVGLVDAAP